MWFPLLERDHQHLYDCKNKNSCLLQRCGFVLQNRPSCFAVYFLVVVELVKKIVFIFPTLNFY